MSGVFLLSAAPLVAWLALRFLVIPLGMVKTAYVLALVQSSRARLERQGIATLAAASALARQRFVLDADAAWVEAKIVALAPARGTAFAAAAMLAFARGDRSGARDLMKSVALVDVRACPISARELATDFLAIDAAERGAWEEVVTVASASSAPGSTARLLGNVARALLGEGIDLTPAKLWLAWLLAPGHATTFALVERAVQALARPKRERRAAAAPAPIEARVDLDGALSLHATTLLAGEAITFEELERVAKTWDEALADENTRAGIAARASSLGAAGPYRSEGEPRLAPIVLERLRTSIEDDLAGVALASDLSLEGLADEGIGAAVRRRLRDELLRDLEIACDALRIRVDEGRALASVDEWREALAILRLYERGARVAGMSFRRLAFLKLHADLTHFSVGLFNKRREHAIGNALFRWLLAEAIALGDEDARDLQEKNARCGV